MILTEFEIKALIKLMLWQWGNGTRFHFLYKKDNWCTLTCTWWEDDKPAIDVEVTDQTLWGLVDLTEFKDDADAIEYTYCLIFNKSIDESLFPWFFDEPNF